MTAQTEDDHTSPVPVSTPELIGRTRVLRLLEDLLVTGETGGAATVLSGEAGMGKTSLLHYVGRRASARGARVLALSGVESEAVLPFAAIADLLLPLRALFDRLPTPQRRAIEVCLSLTPGPVHGSLAACAGALGVFAAAAMHRPLVVLVDDYQWVDPDSAQILSFVARRLAGERMVVVLAVRDEPDAPLRVAELPTTRLAGLSSAECGQLAARMGVPVTGRALSLLVTHTGGNPLAVMESLRMPAWPDRPVGDPLHESLERTWGRLWRELPIGTQIAMFVAVADAAAAGRHLAGALGGLGLDLDILRPAEQLGLISVNGEVALRHPLLRSVVTSRTSLATRISCYQALADVADGHFRSWYLAAAAVGPDDELAATLETAAEDARHRNGTAASARILLRAAELSTDALARAGRLLDAAREAHLAGDCRLAVAWCEEALRYRRDPGFGVDVEAVAGRARCWLGDPVTAFDRLAAAARRVRDVDPARAALAYSEATSPAAMQGRVRPMLAVAEQAVQMWGAAETTLGGVRADPPPVMAQIATAFVLSGQLARALPYLAEAERPVADDEMLSRLLEAVFLAQALSWSERLSAAGRNAGAVVALGRRIAAPSVLGFALTVTAEIAWWNGQWEAGRADAKEALEWATEHDHPAVIGYALSALARLEAGLGEVDACRAHVARAGHELNTLGAGSVRVYGQAALGLAALGVADLSAAVEHLDDSWRSATGDGLANPNAVPMAGDLAEALARQGRADACGAVLTWLDQRAAATGLRYPAVVAARARGILCADTDEAARWFRGSLAAITGDCPMPFERARTELALGEALRRARRPAQARYPLSQAAFRFERLGARVWADRARAELGAAGVRQSPVSGRLAPDIDSLSPQELQVARAAARGLNNREIAGRLFISRKTVEAHLSRTYRKMNVRSRIELARLLLSAGIGD